MAKADAKSLIKRWEDSAALRANWESHWQEIRDHCVPLSRAFQTEEHRGIRTHQRLFDNTAENALDMLAAGLHALLTSPAIQWFKYKMQDDALNDREDVSLWLEEATRRTMAVFNSPLGMFAPNMHETYIDIAAYGTGNLFIGDQGVNGPLFAARPLDEMYLFENNKGRIDTWQRHFKMSARAAVQEWGERKVGTKVATAADGKRQDDDFEFLHVVQPRVEFDGEVGRRAMPHASFWIGLEEKNIIDEGGYNEPPFITPRWLKRSGELYGRGPGGKALSDTKMLQRVMKGNIRAVEKAVDPPLMVVDDGAGGAPIDTRQNAINFFRAGMMRNDPMRPLLGGQRPDLGEEFAGGIRGRIEVAFLIHLLRLQRDPRMTATQVLQITEEVLRLMGPYIGRQEAELLSPMLDRVFGVMLRGGFFDEIPMPEIMQGKQIEIDYISPIAKAQRLAEARGIAQTLEFMEPLITAKPEILDNIEMDKTFRHVADLFSWPKDTLRGMEQVREMRAERAEEEQRQLEEAETNEALATAGTAAKALPAISEALGGGDIPQAANAA